MHCVMHVIQTQENTRSQCREAAGLYSGLSSSLLTDYLKLNGKIMSARPANATIGGTSAA